MDSKLHPTVREFKTFINKHPKLIEEIRKSGRSWQEYYEKWALLGEDDPLWDQFRAAESEAESKSNSSNDKSLKNKPTELFSQLMKYTENMDIDKIQKQAHHLNKTITTIQEALGQYQETKTQQKPKNNHNFNWFHD